MDRSKMPEGGLQQTFLFLAACFCISILGSACSSGDSVDGSDGDAADGDVQIDCADINDCPSGYFCGPEMICVLPAADGDGSEDDPFTPTVILRSVPEDSLNFGNVQISSGSKADVTIFNDGNSTLHLFDANWLAPNVDNPFVLDGYREAAVQAGDSFSFEITFNPQELGEAVGLLRINNDSDNNPQAELDILANVILEQGDAEIGSQPETLLFPDHSVGMRPAQARLRIGNMGPEGSSIILTSVDLQSQTVAPFSIESDDDLSEEEPISVPGGQSSAFSVWFSPTATGEFSDTVIVEYHSDSNENLQTFEVPVSGKAVAGMVALMPTVLDFGLTTAYNEKTLNVRVANGSPDDDVTIISVRVYGVNNWQSFYTFENPPANTVLAPAEQHEFSITFTPDGAGDFSGELMVDSNYQGQKYFFPILAEGTGQNQKPVARVAQRENGPDITAPLNLPMNTSVTLYGDISYDPDGENSNLEFGWFLQKPTGSSASLIPGASSPVVTTMLDVAGSYQITLVVTDEQEEDSYPKNVQLIAESGMSNISVEATYSGISGESDVDLSWILPMGSMCNEDNISANGYCMVPEGWGSARMEGCAAASICTVERVSHANAPDGNYQIRIKFDEDCPGGFIGCPLGAFTENAKVTIQIYENGAPLYRIDNESLNDKGDQKTWNINRAGGTWQQPTASN